MSNKDYGKYSNPISEEVVTEETPVEELVEKETIVKTGIVTDCLKLNVRELPSKDANVLCEILALAEVQINEEESTEDFFKVCTATGIEGFCMKKYIVIR